MPNLVADMHYFIIKPQADISAFFLELFGYVVDQDYMVNGCEARIVFAGAGAICIGSGCSGLELFSAVFRIYPPDERKIKGQTLVLCHWAF
jgi:hypothetical protein